MSLEVSDTLRPPVSTEKAGIQAATLFSEGNQGWNEAVNTFKTGNSSESNNILNGFTIDFGGESANNEATGSGNPDSRNPEARSSERSDEKPSPREERDDTKPRHPDYVDPVDLHRQQQEEESRAEAEACGYRRESTGQPTGTMAGVLAALIDLSRDQACREFRAAQAQRRQQQGR